MHQNLKSGPFFWWQRRVEQVLQWTPGPFPSPWPFGWVLAEILDHKFMNLWGIRRKKTWKKHTTTWKNRESYEQKHEKTWKQHAKQNMKKNDRWFLIWPDKGGQLDRCGALRNPLRWIFLVPSGPVVSSISQEQSWPKPRFKHDYSPHMSSSSSIMCLFKNSFQRVVKHTFTHFIRSTKNDKHAQI